MLAVLLVGCAIGFIGGIMMLIAAAGVSFWWAVGMVLFPPTQLAFLITRWDAAKKPFLIQVAGSLIMLVGAMSYQPDPNDPFFKYQRTEASATSPAHASNTFKCTAADGSVYYQASECSVENKNISKLKAFDAKNEPKLNLPKMGERL